MTSAEVVICGAGIAGVATAYYLATQYHLRNLLLVDAHAPLSQTTAKSGENYRNWWPVPELVDFSARSIELMEVIADATGNRIQMQPRGYLYVSSNPLAEAERAGMAARYGRAGELRFHDGTGSQTYRREWPTQTSAWGDGADIITDRALLHALYPHLAAEIAVAIHVRRAGWISVQQLGEYMLSEVKRCGGRLLRGRLTRVRMDRVGVAGVQVATPAGRHAIDTRNLVVAAGPQLPAVARLCGSELPVFSVLQQKIALQDPLEIVPRSAPFTIFTDAQRLAWSQDEAALLGDDPADAWLLRELPGGLHVRPEGGGDSTWLKLGWAINDVPSEPIPEPELTPAFSEAVLRGASHFIPGLAAYVGNMPRPLVHYSGYYTKTRDNLPLIGPLNCGGAYVVGALSGYGTMAACAAGELGAAWVTGSTRPDYADFFSLRRFAEPTLQPILTALGKSGEL